LADALGSGPSDGNIMGVQVPPWAPSIIGDMIKAEGRFVSPYINFYYLKESQMISIQDFAELDLRAATVVSAEEHPNADKLLVLNIDLGGEQRTIVAGLRGHYEPEQLVGKQLIVVANLEPCELRGVESHGMMLAVRDGEKVIALVPDSEVTSGSKVS
jgi:methionine--tRNA ligase beta chain